MSRILDRFQSDHPEPVTCQVKGTVPGWLNGILYRNGPGLYHIGEDRFKHLFDGMAVLHQYTIKDGEVSYRNRLVQSQTYKRNKDANRIVVSEFGTLAKPDIHQSIFSRYFKYLFDLIANPTDNTCVSLMQIGRQMFAFTETPWVNEIDPETLETIQHVDLRNYMPLTLATAHLLEDSDHTIWNFATTISHASYYTVIRIPPTLDGQGVGNPFAALEIVCKIPARRRLEPGYYHHFGMSENYLVLVEQNLTAPLLSLMSSPFRGISYNDAFNYHPDEKCLFHVVNKKSGTLVKVKFVASAFFVLHHVNTFEDDGHLVVDLCSYRDASVLQGLKLDTDDLLYTRKAHAESTSSELTDQPLLWRFVLPISAEKLASEHADRNLVTLDYTTATAVLQTDGTILCSPQVFDNCALEMPMTNLGVAGGKYRYCYGLNGRSGFFVETKLIKFDFLKNKVTLWSDERYAPGEPIFVAKPAATAEDDGVILSPLVSISDELPSALLILDAATFTEIARAEIPAGIAVTYTCHGIFCEFKD